MDFPQYARAVETRPGRDPSLRNNVIVLRQTASTHLLGRRIVSEYGREGLRAPATDLLAWTQTGGIGRGGGAWSSPPGKGVYLTSIRSLDTRQSVQLLPLAISVSLCVAVNRWLDSEGDRSRGGEAGCRLKWPNDLYAGGRKLGGLLIDVVSAGKGRARPASEEPPFGEPAKPLASLSARAAARNKARRPVAIISVGVNVDRDLSAFEHPRATSVMAEAERRGRTGVALAEATLELIAAIDAGLGVDTGRLIEDYRQLSIHQPGDRLRCRLQSGAVAGTFLGFDRQGFLRLRVGGEERLISSGAITDDG